MNVGDKDCILPIRSNRFDRPYHKARREEEDAHMEPETTIAIQIQEQVFVDTGRREKKIERKQTCTDGNRGFPAASKKQGAA
jgi:hypothetical protein